MHLTMLVRLAALACLSARSSPNKALRRSSLRLPRTSRCSPQGLIHRRRHVRASTIASAREHNHSGARYGADGFFASEARRHRLRKVLYEITYAGCELAPEAIVYGHVTAALASKNPKSSELGLVFDHADCTGNQKQQLHLRLVGLVAPPESQEMEHEVLPSEVRGGLHQLPSTSRAGIDDNLDPSKYPQTVRPGLVVRLPKVKLDPEGAPSCSARISTSAHDLKVAPGSELILTVESLQQASPATP